MNLQAFADELCRLGGGRSALVKVAGLFTRMGSFGAAGSAGGHLLQHGKAMMSGDPMDEPVEGIGSAALKGGLGGLGIAGLMQLILKAKGR